MKEPVIIDLGCGEDPERWVSGAYKVDDGLKEEYAKRNNIINEDFTKGLSFPDNSVDIIFARNSLSWMYGNQETFNNVMNEVLRLLKPNGLLIVQEGLELPDAQYMLECDIYKGNIYSLHRTNLTVQYDDIGTPMVTFNAMYQKY